MKRLLIGLALSLVATAASAQWVLVATGASGTKTYADPASKKRSGNIVRMWELRDYAKAEVINGKLSYSDQMYIQYDCATGTRQSLQTTGFTGKMATGESLGVREQAHEKRFVAPGSVGETLFNLACK